MLIDPILPTILQARGLSRRDAAAALRAHHEKHRHSVTPEATYLIEHALGSPNYSDGEYGEDKYDIAIGKGVRLVERSSGGLAGMRFAAGGGTHRAGTFVVIDKVLPTTVVTSLLGKELHHLIDHPLLPRDAVIRDIQAVGDGTEVHIHSTFEELPVLLPATRNDMEIARRSWARMRRDQVRETGANNGMSPSVRSLAARRALVPSGCAIAGAVAVWNGTGPGDAGARIAAVLVAMLVTAWACIRAYVRMRRHVEAEDHGLLPRLRDLRTRRIMERRKAILEGTEK